MASSDEDIILPNDDISNTMRTYNATPFLQREKYMYAFGDIKFTTPKSLTKIFYFMGALVVYGGLVILFFGFSTNPIYLAILIIPPVLFGAFASRPIFDGRMFIDWANIMFQFLMRDKTTLDERNSNQPDEQAWDYYAECWVSRRDDIALLKAYLNGDIDLVDNLYVTADDEDDDSATQNRTRSRALTNS